MAAEELLAEYRAAQKAHGDRNWHRDYPSMISKTRQRLDAAVRALMALTASTACIAIATRQNEVVDGNVIAARLLPEDDESDE